MDSDKEKLPAAIEDFLGQCRSYRQEREKVYAATGNQSVWVKIPLVDAVLVFTMVNTPEVRRAVKKSDLDTAIEALREVAFLQATEAAIAAANNVKVERDYSNCPEVWKHNFMVSVLSALQSCNQMQQEELIKAVCRDMGLVEKTETENK